jgi:hypothetical protein
MNIVILKFIQKINIVMVEIQEKLFGLITF